MSATGSGDGISSLSEGSVTGNIVSEYDNRNVTATEVVQQDTPSTSESDTLTTATDDHNWNASGSSRSRSTGGTRKRHSTRSASRKK